MQRSNSSKVNLGRASRIASIAVAASLGGACERAPEIDGESANEQAILNGDISTSGTAFNAVMIGQAVGHGCSGALLTNKWALSAHHCFYDDKGNQRPGPWHVQYGGKRNSPLQTVIAKRVIPHPINTAAINPDVVNDRRGVDLVLVELETPLTTVPSAFVRKLLKGPTSQLVGKAITCAGWGGFDSIGSWSQDLRTAILNVSQVNTAHVEDPGHKTKPIHAGDWVHFGRNSRDQITMPGDSGSGCHYLQNGEDVLAGIYGWGDSGSKGAALGMGDDVVRNWLASYIPNYASSEKLRPSASSWPDRLDLYWRAESGAIMHKWHPHGPDWSFDQAIGGDSTSAPGSFSRGVGQQDVFWRGTDWHMRHKWYPHNNAWSWEQDLGGQMLSAPSGGALPNSGMAVFWRGIDNKLHRRVYAPSTDWTGETIVDTSGDLMASGPAVVVRPDGIVDVFWRGRNSRLKHIWYENGIRGAVSQVEELGGTVASDPAATWRPDGILDVFWQDDSGQLKHRWMADNTWSSGEELLGSGLATGPAVSSRGAGMLDVYWRGTDNVLKHIWYPHNEAWSWVQDLGGTTTP